MLFLLHFVVLFPRGDFKFAAVVWARLAKNTPAAVRAKQAAAKIVKARSCARDFVFADACWQLRCCGSFVLAVVFLCTLRTYASAL